MFKYIVAFLASIAAVSAFAPVSRSATKAVSLKMSFEDEIGVLSPTGFWDPLGLAKNIDEGTFARRRAVELKHGRVAMLAVTGYLVAAVARFPGAIDLDGTSFESIPNGVAAIGVIPAFGWFQIAASIGWWEIFGWKQVEGSTPGDFGVGTTFYGKELEGDELFDKKTRELQNGRLAMLGIMELLTHDVAKPAGESLFSWHHF